MLFESKLESTVSNNLFKINGHKIFRYDGNRFGRGFLLLHFRKY